MKPTETFIKTIEQMLEAEAQKDNLFAEKMKNESKNMEECCEYILSEVYSSGFNGFADEEILGMAKHYWDEEEIEIKKNNCQKAVVNHHVELTEEEKKKAKEKAIRELVDAEKKRMTEKKAKPSARKEEANQPTLF